MVEDTVQDLEGIVLYKMGLVLFIIASTEWKDHTHQPLYLLETLDLASWVVEDQQPLDDSLNEGEVVKVVPDTCLSQQTDELLDLFDSLLMIVLGLELEALIS